MKHRFIAKLFSSFFVLLAGWSSALTPAYSQDSETATLTGKGADKQAPAQPQATPVAVAGSMYFSVLVPQEGYARATNGIGIDGGVWIQSGHLVIEPRASVRFDVASPDRDYVHLVPLELGVFGLMNLNSCALYLGPGFGLHGLFESVEVEQTVGSEIEATSTARIEDNVFGVGVFGRAGVVLARSNTLSTALSVDYAVTFAEFARSSLERAVRINLGFVIGRGR